MNNRISELRKSRGWTQDKFAEEMRISKNYVSLIENGKKIPSGRLLDDICQEFNVTEEWLRTGEEPRTPTGKLSSYLAEIAHGKGENFDFIRDLVEVYMELDDKSKEALRVIADRMAEKRKGRE